MNPFQFIPVVLHRWIKSRAASRKHGRGRWDAEALEPRVLLTLPAYELQTGGDNPMDGLAMGPEYFESYPVLVDLDGDNDLDLVVGRSNGISYFENIGTVTVPSFVERTGALNPFSSLDAALIGQTPAPALADWDHDGDLDLLWGSNDLMTGIGFLTAYENTGSASAAIFSPLGPGNPFDGIYNQFTFPPVPAFGDMDGDGDQDLVVTRSSLRMQYYRNTGSPTSPTYVATTVGDPFSSVSLGSLGAQALGDVDNDGDLDLVTASLPLSGIFNLKFFENAGSSAVANFTTSTGVFDDQFSIFTSRVSPALGDLDGDGDMDLLLAVSDGSSNVFRYYKAVENPTASAPKNSVPGFQLAKEDIVLVFSVANGNAITVTDPNSDGSDLQVTLSVDQGTLTLATTNGLNFSFSDAQGTGVGDGIKDATMTFRGTLAEINAALDGLKFIPTVDYSGDVVLTITTNDLGQPGGGAALSDTDVVPITVQSVATQVEQTQLYINFLVEFSGLNQHAANVLLQLLNLTGRPAADAARIKAFTNVVRAFGRAGILTDGSDLYLLELAQDILTGIKTRAN